MRLVLDLITKEVNLKSQSLAKLEALKKKIKERSNNFSNFGTNPDDDSKSEIDEM